MNKLESKSFIEESLHFYEFLLRFYPKSYYKEYAVSMKQTFRDMLSEAVESEGRNGVIKLWISTLKDFSISLLKEHTDEQTGVSRADKRLSSKPAILGGLFILPTFLFLSMVFVQYGLKFGTPVDSYSSFANTNLLWNMTFRMFEPVIFFIAPFLALFINTVPLVKIKVNGGGGSFISAVRIKTNVFNISIALISIILLSVVVGYGIVENLPCLMNQKLHC